MRLLSMAHLVFVSVLFGSEHLQKITLPDDCLMHIYRMFTLKQSWLIDDVPLYTTLGRIACCSKKQKERVAQVCKRTEAEGQQVIDCSYMKALSQKLHFAAADDDQQKQFIRYALEDLRKQGSNSARTYGLTRLSYLTPCELSIEAATNPDLLDRYAPDAYAQAVTLIQPDVTISFLSNRYRSLDAQMITQLARLDVICSMSRSERSYRSYIVCSFDCNGVLQICVFHGPRSPDVSMQHAVE